MSHVATVDIEIKDLDALDAACRRLGLELVRGQKQFRHYGGQLGECEHAIVVKDKASAYEIGLVKREGRPGWQIDWDDYAGGKGLVERVGKDCVKLKQAYATAVAIRHAQRNGWRVNEQRQQDGSILLRLTK